MRISPLALSLTMLLNTGSVIAGEQDLSGMASDIRQAAAAFYAAAKCDFSAPDDECVGKIMTPLNEAGDIPFDKEAVLRAFTAFGPYVAKEWQLTTLHRLPHEVMGSLEDCAFSEFQYSDVPFSVPGCGVFLFIGGHPKIKNCEPRNDPFRCLGKIPAAEQPDIGLIRTKPRDHYLQVAGIANLSGGDIVFVVHQPFFQWMDYEHGAAFRNKSPYLTKALFLWADGTTAALLAPVFQGSSGGTVINKEGKVIGILTSTVAGLPIAYFQKLDPRMIEVIESAARQ